MDERLKRQLDFILEIDKEKNIFRQTQQTPEAKFAHSLDNLQPLLLNNSNEGADWKAHGVTARQV